MTPSSMELMGDDAGGVPHIEVRFRLVPSDQDRKRLIAEGKGDGTLEVSAFIAIETVKRFGFDGPSEVGVIQELAGKPLCEFVLTAMRAGVL